MKLSAYATYDAIGLATAIAQGDYSRGEVVAFLGPNGAGKSTTLKLLTGYLSPSAGDAWIGGHNICTDRLAAADILGYLPEEGPLYQDMTPRESLASSMLWNPNQRKAISTNLGAGHTSHMMLYINATQDTTLRGR